MLRAWWLSGGLTTIAVGALLVVLIFVRPLGDALWRRATSQSLAIPPPGPVFSAAPTIEQVQLLAELVSLRVRVVDILTVEQNGWLNGYKGAC
jgi:hypothetical protein